MEDFIGHFMYPVADFFCQSFHKFSQAALQFFVVHGRHHQVAGETQLGCFSPDRG